MKDAVSIPVIGNGDIFTPEQFKARLAQSGVDAIMVARGAIANPAIFKQINDYLNTNTYEPIDKIELFGEYQQYAKKYNIPFQQLKTHALGFTKGMPSSTVLRQAISVCQSVEELEQCIEKVHVPLQQ